MKNDKLRVEVSMATYPCVTLTFSSLPGNKSYNMHVHYVVHVKKYFSQNVPLHFLKFSVTWLIRELLHFNEEEEIFGSVSKNIRSWRIRVYTFDEKTSMQPKALPKDASRFVKITSPFPARIKFNDPEDYTTFYSMLFCVSLLVLLGFEKSLQSVIFPFKLFEDFRLCYRLLGILCLLVKKKKLYLKYGSRSKILSRILSILLS